jgi:NagD protein
MYFIDVQGTIIDDLDKKPIDGAIELIDYLNENDIDYMIVTNNTKQSSEDFLAYLHSIGFNIPKDKYLDPIMLIDTIVTDKSIAAFGHKDFLKVLQDKGYILEYKNPKSVVVGVSHEYDMDDFATMNECLLNGAELIGMHLTTLYAKNGRRYPGVGAILEMLRLSTGKMPKVVGKPSESFYQKAFAMSDAISYEEIMMISDDVKGDLLGAKALGMETAFVLSGKYKSADEVLPDIDTDLRPAYTVDSIKDIYNMIKKGDI